MESRKLCSIVAIFIVLCIVFPKSADLSTRAINPNQNIRYQLVHAWADKLGAELFHLGNFITRKKEVQDSFKSANVAAKSGNKIVETIANDLSVMMELKISAVRRIMNNAEEIALSHQHDQPVTNLSYYNAKEMLEPGETPPPPLTLDIDFAGIPPANITPKTIILTPMPEFFDEPINTSVSSVHVPTNVFDRAPDVIQAIEWSEKLDEIFKNNYKEDPTLSWQFFGSSYGFMRQYPSSKWKQDPVDLYDCRLRSWYMEAATSPKDVIVLLDGSGSMHGQRLDIARHIVYTILDTLGTNDFVNIFTFGTDLKAVVDCFNETLVQATLGNIRELKFGLNDLKVEGIANFSNALTTSFLILEDFRENHMGANCNQAIMIISDGAPFLYTEIFEEHNWNKDYMPVRIFTYVIGKEVSDVAEMKYMACKNQGYYVHLSDMAEVREMVLNYVPVMARPLVLTKGDHPVAWSQIYADEVDIKLSDWNWELRQNERQKHDIEAFRELGVNTITELERARRAFNREKMSWDQPSSSSRYNFMTTISMPVYDKRENATRIANLLGVAGTDVPIRDIKRIISHFSLGVNGYAFIVTNNGFILFHPDFRPTFQEILKPTYNSVDMIEVELLDDNRDSRDFNPMLISIREEIIKQTNGSKWMMVKNHYDSMRRVLRIKRQYYWTAIKNTPFTLVITYPEAYGINRISVRNDEDIHRMIVNKKNISSFFVGDKWRIHPEWLYCKNHTKTFDTPEAELRHFIQKMSKPGWKWPPRSPVPPEHTAALYSNTSFNISSGRIKDRESYYCDHALMQALVFDAKNTEWFSANNSFNRDDKGNEFKQRFGVTVAFMATHSGLTRWQEFRSNNAEDLATGDDFGEKHNKGPEEIWYQRAVEQHFIKDESFVYSVPFDATEKSSEIIVTASQAVFHTEKRNKAPAAVVGFQFKHAALVTIFKNITSTCAIGGNCTKNCSSDDVECYVLDDNGYVVVSPRLKDTGRFFGQVNGWLMQRLISDNIYEPVKIYDYQAICFEVVREPDSAARILSPFLQIVRFGVFILKTIILMSFNLAKTAAQYIPKEYLPIPELKDLIENNKIELMSRLTLPRTILKACDHERTLYTFKENNLENDPTGSNGSNGCEKPFVISPIQRSNLVLLVVDTMCPRDTQHYVLTDPKEIRYNESLACEKKNTLLSRRKPVNCTNNHVEEVKIELCGHANNIVVNYVLILVSLILISY